MYLMLVYQACLVMAMSCVPIQVPFQFRNMRECVAYSEAHESDAMTTFLLSVNEYNQTHSDKIVITRDDEVQIFAQCTEWRDASLNIPNDLAGF